MVARREMGEYMGNEDDTINGLLRFYYACKGYTNLKTFKEWKEDYKFLTELTLVLNHKIWQYYENRPDMAVLYNTLWEQADQYAKENLKGNELSYYWEVTD